MGTFACLFILGHVLISYSESVSLEKILSNIRKRDFESKPGFKDYRKLTGNDLSLAARREDGGLAFDLESDNDKTKSNYENIQLTYDLIDPPVRRTHSGEKESSSSSEEHEKSQLKKTKRKHKRRSHHRRHKSPKKESSEEVNEDKKAKDYQDSKKYDILGRRAYLDASREDFNTRLERFLDTRRRSSKHHGHKHKNKRRRNKHKSRRHTNLVDGDTMRFDYNPLPSGRRSFFRYDPNYVGPILGAPSLPSHLPEAEPILPGHTLIRPAMGMLKSSVKFPHKELEDGSGVYGSWNNLGIRYDGRNERVLYTGFRRNASPSRRSLADYIMIVPSKKQSKKSRYSIANLVLDMDEKSDTENKILDTLDSIEEPVPENNKLILYIANQEPKSLQLSDLLKEDNKTEYNSKDPKRHSYSSYSLKSLRSIDILNQTTRENKMEFRQNYNTKPRACADDAKKWFENAGRDTSDWFKNTGRDTSNWFKNTGRDTSDWFKNAGKDTKNWIVTAFEDVKDWFKNVG